ncbi:MAG: OmpA family protein, partial [Breznakibacter sp.]|nr:OmpA family protein [Breznakibacter sp.]
IAAEQARLEALARQKAYDDSVANALYLAELRNKHIADSIANAQRLADEAARLALLAKLVEEQRIKDSIANAKEVAVIMDIKTKTLSDDELALLKLPIIFAKGSADITDQSKINAQRIGAMLAKHPDLLFRITGHTCDLGDDKVNYRLGLRRAETLFREFSSAGVKASQITTFSKGELEPLYPNINEDNRRRNRRVVVVIEDEVKKSTEEQVYR